MPGEHELLARSVRALAPDDEAIGDARYLPAGDPGYARLQIVAKLTLGRSRNQRRSSSRRSLIDERRGGTFL
jgi:hypothetical protein